MMDNNNNDKKVKELLVEKGYDQKLGARPLRRSIQENFEDALADQLLKEKSQVDILAKATVKSKKIVFTITHKKVNKNISIGAPKKKRSPKKTLVSTK